MLSRILGSPHAPERPHQRRAQWLLRRHGTRHRMAQFHRKDAAPKPNLIALWLDDRRALPLKWGLLALLLLGVALLEGPL